MQNLDQTSELKCKNCDSHCEFLKSYVHTFDLSKINSMDDIDFTKFKCFTPAAPSETPVGKSPLVDQIKALKSLLNYDARLYFQDLRDRC